MKSWTLLVIIISIRCFGIRGEDKQAQNFSLTPIKQQGDGKRPFSAVTNIIPTYTYEYRSNQPLDVKFTSGTSIYQCTVSEIAPVGTVLESDVKVGVYSHDNDRSINFKIVEGSKLGTFKVEARRVSDFIFMDIKTKTRLNRESEPSYFFSVVAEDAASKVILDRARVNVTVSDVNDNRPIFLTRRIFATVREDVSLHSSVTQVQAVDADVGANGLIYFSFYKKTHYFAINPVSGVVTATRHLDATRKRHHMLEVVARDRSLAPYSPRTTRGCFINITVEPVNEFAPKVFVLKEIQNVTEGKYGIVYSVIKISDRDKGESGQIDKVEITSGNEKGNFAVRRSKTTSDEFSIEVIKPLDREDSNHGYHHLVVNVTDKGIPIKYTTRAFHIKIIDVNDMTPTFNKSSYSATISELAPVNTPVISVFAKDKDKGINSEIIYAITKGNEHGTFVINAETGLILTKTPLDYETKSHFSLQVAALDKGPQATRKMSFVHVSITVVDENDHSPIFEHSSYRKELYEDLLKGTSVLKVSASDIDSGSNGVIKYNIVNEEPVPFEINQDTGLISASETLDRDMGIPEYITLKVWASDFGKPIRRETETLVHFKVKSFNDNRPIFKQFHCDIELSQHAPKGTVLTRLTAVDIDFDSNSNIAYRFAVGNTGDNFVVEPKSGIVRTAKKLTKDVRKANLYVVATDGKQESADPVFLRIKIVSGRHARRLSNYVGVQCVDTPDFAKAEKVKAQQRLFKPSFPVPDKVQQVTSNKYAPNIGKTTPLVIKEDIPVGTSIGKVTATDTDHGYNGLIVYSITSGNTGDKFAIDMFSGEIRVSNHLDREDKAQYKLNITASDCGTPTKVSQSSVKISVTDVNDNAPTFDRPFYDLSLYENITTGQTVVEVHATDPDEGSNGKVSYQLVNDFGGRFRINAQTGRISVNSKLDYEEQQVYDIEVRALDGSENDQKLGYTKIHLQLLDLNDNAPIISPNVIAVSVPEDVPTEAIVTSINAFDPDTGMGGKLKYKFTETVKKFKIDSETGIIRVRRPLDYERKMSYNLTVEVVDRGEPSLSSRAHVIVKIADVNENNLAPKFSGRPLLQGVIDENKPAGSTVLRVIAQDRDSWFWKYSLIDGTGMDKFTVHSDSGVLMTTEVLDHEEADHYWLTVQAKDGEHYPLYTNIPVLINVRDVNDKPPFFDPPVYYPSVSEGSAVGTSVVQIVARDPDSDGSGLRYSITKGNEDGYFMIDGQTGLITTVSPMFDRETLDNFPLTVTVSDGGSPPKLASTSFVVAVSDINDNAPLFTDSSYFIELEERSASVSPVPVFHLFASDKDVGTNADLTFSIVGGNNDNVFSMDSKNGVISTKKALLDAAEYDLTVNVADGGTPKMDSNVSVTFTIRPKNPQSLNAPMFRDKLTQFQLKEDKPIGTFVTTVYAEDTDGDFLTYYFASGNNGNKFRIESAVGIIEVAGKLDHETQKSFVLKVAASDSYNVAMTTVVVNITDVNDNSPEPLRKEYQAHIAESAPLGTLVTKVKAVDPDSGAFGEVKYSIVNSALPKSKSLFKINSTSGEITTTKMLDFEDLKKHILIIRAADSESNDKTSLFYVVISVDDVNDHKPEFVKPLYLTEVDITAAVSTKIVKVLAVDADSGANAQIKYSITGGNDENAFYIDQNSGAIQVAKVLSPLLKTYKLTVQALDNGVPSLSNSVDVEITVRGITVEEKFEKPLYQASIAENSLPNQAIVTVQHSGLMVSYELVPSNTQCRKYFHINRDNGLITNKVALDAELISQCKLTVRAVGADGRQDTTRVIITITDVNDNSPQFTLAHYTGQVLEASPQGTTVLTTGGKHLKVQASDLDSGDNSKLLYEIVEESASRVFQVDALTGVITTAQVLDYETSKFYQFQLKVSDEGVPSRSAFAAVTINVQDTNDLSPVFTRTTYNTVLYLPIVEGTKVTTVTAIDHDSPHLTNLTYTGSSSDMFQVGLRTGDITVKNASHLRPVTYNIVVEANDGKNRDSATVNIRCLPIISSDFKFQRINYTTNIIEGLTSSAELLSLRAVGYNTQDSVSYSIVSPTDLFVMEEGTGVLRLRGSRAIDRETIDSYNLLVQARDERKPPRIARTTVIVTVDDKNDNMPTFIESPYYFVVQLDLAAGSAIGRMKATDADIGSNGEIRYKLTKGGDRRFRVNHRSGEVTLSRGVGDIIVPKTFILEVEATDKGMPPFASKVQVKVKVVDKETPIFDQQNYATEVLEDTRVGVLVLVIKARSPSGSNVLYSITNGDPLNQFSIDFRTGEIVTAAPLDYEAQTDYTLTIHATDAKTGAHTETPVTISIRDVNDLPPVFNSSLYIGKVSESATVGSSVLKVYASDGDDGINKRVKFWLHKNGESSSTYFAIDEDTGVISTAKVLDYEQFVMHELSVVATDGGFPPLTGQTRVRVVVQDANDNPPRFEKSVYAASILGNAVPGHFVTRVIATDPDEGDTHKLSYKLISGLGKERFNIDSKSGVITLSRDVSVVHGKLYDITVQVTDGKHSATCKVDIVIGATNEYSPTFSKTVYRVELYENLPEGSFVSMVTATDLDSGTFAQLRYSIDSAEAQAMFSIDRDTGMIYSRTVFDRENISHSVMSLPVRATDGGGRFSFCTVEVHIKDENDNQPSFEFESYEVTIPVSINIGTPVLMTSATDKDSGNNAKLSYDIVGHQTPPVFTINTNSGVITVAKEPEVQTYKFFAFVKDGGNPRLHKLVPAQIRVLRRGARIARFERSKYDFSVIENKSPGTSIGQLRLLTPDGGNPRVEYTIVQGRIPDASNEMFFVDPRGHLTLVKALDYEKKKRYVMVIEANITSLNQIARTAVVVHVQDHNDNNPIFASNPYLVSVPENINVGSLVLRVFAEDLDRGKNGEVEYSFRGADQITLDTFSINKKTGWISTKGKLDREATQSFVFNIRAIDKGSPSRLSGDTSVHVTLLDVNDSPPKFNKPVYLASVKEDALIGQEVTTLVATDPDVSAALHYFIMSGDPKAMFNIERKTGRIFVQAPLDRESVSRYQLNVSASDGLFTSFVTLRINVLDANDNSPVCKESLYTTRVSEDIDVGTSVLTVSASDADIGSNAVVKYTVSGQGSGVFAADSRTGILQTQAKLDREVRPLYNFLVAAVDGGGQMCYTNITIILDDVNDNAPKFSQARYVHSVYENAPINKVLLQVKATDSDLGVNRKTTYSLLNDAHGTFAIEPGTGIISLKKLLNREKKKKYTLKVRVEDAGTPRKSANAFVQIDVLNINDVPPAFANSSYKVRVREDTKVGSNVTRVFANSKEDQNEVITYKILKSSDATPFTIDSKSGMITLTKSLDYESGQRSYTFTVQASDSGPPVLSSTAVVKVTVTDANDNKPVFKDASYQANVDENSPVDTIVMQMFATDKDSLDNGKISYSIVNGNSEGKFKMNPNSGLISVAEKIDRESKSSYVLTVRAEDRGTPAMSSEVTVKVIVNDLNDNPPEFTRTNFTVTLREDAKFGTTILHLRPHDLDGHGNGSPYTFTLLNGDAGKFFLTPQGALKKIGTLLSKKEPYVLRIQVGDSGEPPLSTIVTVSIKVVEGITHQPVVRPLTIHVNLYGSNFNGGRIGHIKVTDQDDDQVDFALVADRSSGIFSVSPDGVVSATGNVRVGTYNLTLRARDSKYTVYTHVTVIVRDITTKALANSITLRLADMSAGTFIERYFERSTKVLGQFLKVSPNNVHIWSIQSSGDDLDLVVAARKTPNRYFSGAHLLRKINATRDLFEHDVKVRLRTVGVRQCQLLRCPAHLSCSDVYKPENKQIRFMSDETSYISYEHSTSHACICKDGSRVCSRDLKKCSSKPCAPGYMCTEVPHGYQCKYKDETACEDTSCIKGTNAATFGGQGYVRISLKETFDQPSRSVSLAFRTVEEHGTLVFAGGQYDYSILEISKGFLQLRFDFGSGPGIVIIDWSRADDGKWHHVSVERHGNHATLILDKKHRASGQSPGKMRILNLDGNPIYFGAKVVNTRMRRDSSGNVRVTNGIKGCLQNLKLNGRNLPMSGSNNHATAHPKGMRHGCVTSGACSQSNRCPQFADCVETLSSFKCVCRPGHSGPNCDANIKCDAQPCLNGGTCSDFAKGYRCSCPFGFVGSQCHRFVGACSSMPCKNGGTCRPDGNAKFVCKCPLGVSGTRCEVDYRPCSSSPCNFDGNCTNIGNDYECKCPHGLSGKNCEIGFHCNRIPCKNGGSCEVGASGAECLCVRGFTGLDCGRDVNECQPKNPCKNRGVCFNKYGSFVCNCTEHYSGELCETVLPSIAAVERGMALEFKEIIIIAVILVLFILVVVLVVVFLRRRNRRKRRKDAKDVKVSPPVVGPDMQPSTPPAPPPRQILGYELKELSMPPGYDAEDSWNRRQRAQKALNSVNASDTNIPGYHWDYTDTPIDLVPRKNGRLSKNKSASYMGVPDESCRYVDMSPEHPEGLKASQSSDLSAVPAVPQRPRNFRLSESEDGPPEIPHMPKKPVDYRKAGRVPPSSRYSMDSRFSECSDFTDINEYKASSIGGDSTYPDIFRGRFPGPPHDPYPESCDNIPIGSYVPTLKTRSELGSVTDGCYSEDELEQLYLGNRLEVCGESPENSYLHSENASEDGDVDDSYATGYEEDDLHDYNQEIRKVMEGLEVLAQESQL